MSENWLVWGKDPQFSVRSVVCKEETGFLLGDVPSGPQRAV